MKLKLNTVFIALFAMLIVSVACEKADPIIPNEEEVITTLRYTLTPTNGGAPTVLQFQDLDGDGGNDPIITAGVLALNTTYTAQLELLNEQSSPAEDITAEIEEEAEEHQFFFETTIPDLRIAYSDEDANGNPIGLRTDVLATSVGMGTITITLKHEPNKTAPNVASGDSSNAGGETDIEITFDIDVQ